MNIKEILEKHRKWLNDEEGGERANLRFTDLSGSDLSGSNLRYANICFTNLRGADLHGADLRFTDLSSSSLKGANLSGSNLRSAEIRDTNLRYANLRDTNLRGVKLNGVNLNGADLSGASLRDALTGINTYIKSIFLEGYPIVYTHDRLQIGCENHAIEEWRTFNDRRIFEMDGKDALMFWRKWKDFIFQAIEMAPAKDTFTPEARAFGQAINNVFGVSYE